MFRCPVASPAPGHGPYPARDLTQKVTRFMSGYRTTSPSDAAPNAWLYWFSCSSTASPALSCSPRNAAGAETVCGVYRYSDHQTATSS